MAKNQHIQREKIKISSINWLSKSIFDVKNRRIFFLFFISFSFKNTNLGYHFFLESFLFFESLHNWSHAQFLKNWHALTEFFKIWFMLIFREKLAFVRTHQLWNSTTELILIFRYSKVRRKTYLRCNHSPHLRSQSSQLCSYCHLDK